MTAACILPNCGRVRSSAYSAHCHVHKANNRRHGAPDQEGVGKGELKPWAGIVEDYIARNAGSPAWATLVARWKALLVHARGLVAAYENGRPSVSWEVVAAREVVRLDALVEPRQVLVTVAAMVLMQEEHPRRFRSDRAFRIQVARRVRGLTEANATTYRDWATGKTKRTYRELGPRAAEVLGVWLLEAAGLAGLHIARREAAARAEKVRASRELHEDLEALS